MVDKGRTDVHGDQGQMEVSSGGRRGQAAGLEMRG